MSSLEAALAEIQSFSLFHGLAREEIAKLCEEGRIVVTDHRQSLFEAGEEAHSFGLVLSGAYKLCRPSADGTPVIVYFSTPGDVLAALIMGHPEPRYPISAISMGPSRFLRIPRRNYKLSWLQRTDLIMQIQNLLSTRMVTLHDQKTFNRAPLNAKIAALLISLLEKNKDQRESILPIPITRKEIAESMGASVESVIRIMSEWSKEGIIHTTDHQIAIIKVDRLIGLLKVT